MNTTSPKNNTQTNQSVSKKTIPTRPEALASFREKMVAYHTNLQHPGNDNIKDTEYELLFDEAYQRNSHHISNIRYTGYAENIVNNKNIRFKDTFKGRTYRKALTFEGKKANKTHYHGMVNDLIFHGMHSEDPEDVKHAIRQAVKRNMCGPLREGLEYLQAEKPDLFKKIIEMKEKDGGNLLHLAVKRKGSTACLIDFGVDPAATDKNNKTAMSIAIDQQKDKTLNAYTSRMGKNKGIMSLYFKAAATGDLETLQHLVETCDIDVNTKTDDNFKNTAAHLASSGGHAHVIDYLADKKASFNARNAKKQTPIHKFKNVETLEALTRKELGTKKAWLNALDENKRSALMYKSQLGQTVNAFALIGQRAKLDLQDHLDNTAAMYTIGPKKAFTVITKALARAGANLNLQNENGNTVVNRALFWKHTALSSWLLNRKELRTDVKNKYGNEYTHIAAMYGDLEAIDVLKERKADFNRKNEKLQIPFEAAKDSYQFPAAVKTSPNDPSLTLSDKAQYYFTGHAVTSGVKTMVNKFNSLAKLGMFKRSSNDNKQKTSAAPAPEMDIAA